MKTAEQILDKHCTTTFNKHNGDEEIQSSKSAVVVAMEEFAKEYHKKQLTLTDVVASLPDEEMIYVSHGSDGDDDVYCAFTDLSKAEKDCEEAGTSLSTISLYRK